MFFACSEAAGEWMFGGERYHIMNNALDTAVFQYNETVRDHVRNELGFNGKNFVIGHVGRFDQAKNQSFLLDIFAEIAKIDRSARLLLIGDGVLKKEMQAKAVQLQVMDRVLFMGVRPDVAQLMQGMDLLLFPSKYEGLPVTLVEAQTAGLDASVA